MIDIATELFEKSVKDCQNTVYHFIKSNRWFTGKIYLLTTSNSYPTTSSIDSIRKIYSNVELINVSANSEFVNSLSGREVNRSNIWKYCLAIDTYRLLYMSNYSVVSNDLSNIITEKTSFISDSCDFIYFNGNRNKISITSTDYAVVDFIAQQPASISLDGILVYSSSIPDRIYASSLNILKNSSIIVFDTLTTNLTSSARVNSVRLHKVRETLAYLSSPSAKIVQRAVYTPIPKTGVAANKTIDAPVKTPIRTPRADSRYVLDPVKLKASQSDMLHIAQSELTDSTPAGNYETACIIAFKDRHSIVQLNVECLNNQTLKPAIVLVASNLSDAEFAIELSSRHENVFVTLFNNYPIGAKWQAGVDYARKLNVSGVIILGSDDLLSLDYIKTCFDKIDYGKGSSGNGVDLVGNRSWYIYDTFHSLYYLQYTRQVPIFLGGGRMFSRHFLDSVDWVIFNRERPVHLDEHGYEAVRDFSNSILELDQSQSIVSIKGSWDMINPTSQILAANRRIISTNVTQNREAFFNDLKIPNIDDYLI